MVKKIVLNPKAISMGEMYGEVNQMSQEWTDGLASKVMRIAAQETEEEKTWVVFDGPVDAIWIENMNTVLDDNRKLCLMSGEVISMSANMNMIFEPMDLAVASPATVSRCGMVYLQPHEMGWMHLYTSWKNKLPTRFGEDQIKVLDQLVNVVIQPTLDYIFAHTKVTTPVEEQCLVVGMLRIWRALLKVFDDENHFAQFDKK
jgi:dynein heavy chain